MLCIEKTFEQFNKEQEESRQRLIQEEKEYKRKIPELSKYYQGHSGMSWELINSMDREFCDCGMVGEFCDCGNEFLEQLGE
jgi:hypothetical protein